MEMLMKYGPHIVGLVVAILGMVFFVVRFLIGRVYKGMDLALGKADALEKRVRNLELLAAGSADSTVIVGKLMGNGK